MEVGSLNGSGFYRRDLLGEFPLPFCSPHILVFGPFITLQSQLRRFSLINILHRERCSHENVEINKPIAGFSFQVIKAPEELIILEVLCTQNIIEVNFAFYKFKLVAICE